MEQETPKKRSSPVHLLVIECSSNLNWYEIFEATTFQGQKVVVEQAEWDDVRFPLSNIRSKIAASSFTATVTVLSQP
jgi:hypothetical protein